MLTKAELQRLRSLREKKTREALGLFIVEGEKVVAELLAAKFPFTEIYATPAWSHAFVGDAAPLPRRIEITPDEMARISHFPTPSTVLAVSQISRLPLAPGTLDRGLTLALDGVQDPGNVGTLLRVADWFAFDRVVLRFGARLRGYLGLRVRDVARIDDLAQVALGKIGIQHRVVRCPRPHHHVQTEGDAGG